MYRNLKAEMLRKNVSYKDLASLLNTTERTISNKVYGKTFFKSNEMFLIKETFFEDIGLDYLFRFTPSA